MFMGRTEKTILFIEHDIQDFFSIDLITSDKEGRRSWNYNLFGLCAYWPSLEEKGFMNGIKYAVLKRNFDYRANIF